MCACARFKDTIIFSAANIIFMCDYTYYGDIIATNVVSPPLDVGYLCNFVYAMNKMFIFFWRKKLDFVKRRKSASPFFNIPDSTINTETLLYLVLYCVRRISLVVFVKVNIVLFVRICCTVCVLFYWINTVFCRQECLVLHLYRMYLEYSRIWPGIRKLLIGLCNSCRVHTQTHTEQSVFKLRLWTSERGGETDYLCLGCISNLLYGIHTVLSSTSWLESKCSRWALL